MKHDPDYTHTFADRHPQFVLDDVRVPASAILGGIGRADDLTNEWFVEERIHIGARCAGAMERLLDLAVDWATGRSQFGQRIYDFQGVSFPLADSAADASAARLLTREAAALADAGADPRSSTPRRRWRSCSRPRPRGAAPTVSSRSSAAAATCASFPPSATSASSASTGSGREPRRSSG